MLLRWDLLLIWFDEGIWRQSASLSLLFTLTLGFLKSRRSLGDLLLLLTSQNILTCRKRKSFSAFLSLCSLSSCSCGSRGSCLMTSPCRGPVSCADVDEEHEEEEESPWCSRSSSSVSSGWLWCCLAGPEAPLFTVETWSPGLDMIYRGKREAQVRWQRSAISRGHISAG